MDALVLKDKTVVIADDYQINVELLSIIVEGAGAVVLQAFNGKECVDIVCRQHVDMILMDKHMPVMDGLEASRAIRTLPQGSSIIIIGVTGSSETLEVEECKAAGMNMVYEKATLDEQLLYEIGEHYFGSNSSKKPEIAKVLAVDTEVNSTLLVMDFPKALREFENDHDLLYSLMRDFSLISREKIALMRNALTMLDYLCIQAESHGIKGGAANLCALPLSHAAADLERACKQHEENDVVASLLEKLTCSYTQFDYFVNSTCPV